MPTEESVRTKNITVQNKFYTYVQNKDKKLHDELCLLAKQLHNHQWTQDQVYNILDVNSNCYNNCKYCYMKTMKQKFFHVDIENLDMVINDKKVQKKWKKMPIGKHIMFPSSHDIFDEYIDKYISTAKAILGAGNTLLIVTKPRLSCVTKMIQELKKQKDKILFRLTITSDDKRILKYYEPNASTFDERFTCLKKLFDAGFRTSVSMEPYLSNPKTVIDKINEYVTDDIWIGTMSGLNTNDKIDTAHKSNLEKIYSKDYVMDMVNNLKNNPKIFWKTSIMKIVLK